MSDTPTAGTVDLAFEQGVATVTFNRPQARNAMTWAMYQQLSHHCDHFKADPKVRAVVFRGAGGQAFVAGTDIEQFTSFKTGEDGVAYERQIEACIDLLCALPMPTVALIEGWAVGGGLAIATACDFRLATPGSQLGVPIAKTLGNCLSAANVARLMAALGTQRVKRMLMLAEMVGADEALACGYLHQIASADDIAAATAALVQRLTALAPVTQHVSKQNPEPPGTTQRTAGRGPDPTSLWQRRLPRGRKRLCGQTQTSLERPLNMASPPRTGPLAGLRVLEMTQIMSGPTCGLLLADLGADVIKIEKLPGGDDARGYRDPQIHGVSAPFLMLNRNKRGLALDLKKPEGRALLLRMVKKADVLVENFRGGTMEKLGLGYDALRAANPGLIYCAISGYGRTGPYADKGGFDLIAQGFAGLMAVTGEPGRPPAKSGNAVSDMNAGILAATGILAAYIHKLKTGEGQIVDTSLSDAALQQTYWHAAVWLATQREPQPTGSAHILTAPYQAFEASDGWINIGGANQSNWERICQVLGHPEWRTDPRFATNSDRMLHLNELVSLMNAVLRTRTRAQWQAEMDAAGVPAGPVHTIGEALSHPQTLARGMVVTLEHPQAGTVRGIGCPIHFSHTPTDTGQAAPLLGQHTRELLQEHGLNEAEIDALIAQGAVAQAAA